MLHMF